MKKSLMFIALIAGLAFATSNLKAQPLSSMTEAQINALSPVKLKKMVIDDWGSNLLFMIQGVKYPEKVVNVFAENFKGGAVKWLNKSKWLTVDYLVAEALKSFYDVWYRPNGNYYDAVIAMHQRTLRTTIDAVMYKVMSSTEVIYRRQQNGFDVTPSELVGANELIYNLKSKSEAEIKQQIEAEKKQKEAEKQRVALLEKIDSGEYFRNSFSNLPSITINLEKMMNVLGGNKQKSVNMNLNCRLSRDEKFEIVNQEYNSYSVYEKEMIKYILNNAGDLKKKPGYIQVDDNAMPVNSILDIHFIEERIKISPIIVIVEKRIRKKTVEWEIKNIDAINYNISQINQDIEHQNNHRYYKYKAACSAGDNERAGKRVDTLNAEKFYQGLSIEFDKDAELSTLKKGKYTLTIRVTAPVLRYFINDYTILASGWFIDRAVMPYMFEITRQ